MITAANHGASLPVAVRATTPRLGRLLLDRGVIGPAQLNAAISAQRVTQRPLHDILVSDGYATARDVAEAMASASGTPFVDLRDVMVDEATARLLSAALARRLEALPIGIDGDRVVVAMTDPSNVLALDDVHLSVRQDVEPVAVEREQLMSAIASIWSEHGAGASVERDAGTLHIAHARDAVHDDDVVRLVDGLLHRAVELHASDLHADAVEHGLTIRARVDGVLYDMTDLPKSDRERVIARLKVMTGMDIADHRVPQDGRMTLIVDERPVDVRAVALPTAFGESVVLRILDKHRCARCMTSAWARPA